MVITNGVWCLSDITEAYDTVNIFLRPRSLITRSTSCNRRIGLAWWHWEFLCSDTSQSCLSHWETDFFKWRWSGEIPGGPHLHTVVKRRWTYLVTRPNQMVTILSSPRMLLGANLFAQSFVHSSLLIAWATSLFLSKISPNLDLEDGGSNPIWQFLASSSACHVSALTLTSGC